MNLYRVKFRASKRRVPKLPRGMQLWPVAMDAVLTRHMDLEPEARIVYVGDVEAPDPDEAHAVLKLCYEKIVVLQTKRISKKTGPVSRQNPWPPDED